MVLRKEEIYNIFLTFIQLVFIQHFIFYVGSLHLYACDPKCPLLESDNYFNIYYRYSKIELNS